MYTHFFGNYLLNKGAITSEQLVNAMGKESETHVKLGTLAVHAGYMTPSEVEDIFILQTHEDKRFGELAIERGYLTIEQVDDLLSIQVPDFFLLGQILVEHNVITSLELDRYISDYRFEYEIDDLFYDQEQQELVHHLLKSLSVVRNEQHKKCLHLYLLLLFNNLIRFIGNDFTPMNVEKAEDFKTMRGVIQNLEMKQFPMMCVFSMEERVAIDFASRYAQDSFDTFDEFVRASMEDFLNLHNGLYAVNMSNEMSLEVTLQPPETTDEYTFSGERSIYIVPILYSFGLMHFVCIL